MEATPESPVSSKASTRPRMSPSSSSTSGTGSSFQSCQLPTRLGLAQQRPLSCGSPRFRASGQVSPCDWSQDQWNVTIGSAYVYTQWIVMHCQNGLKHSDTAAANLARKLQHAVRERDAVLNEAHTWGYQRTELTTVSNALRRQLRAQEKEITELKLSQSSYDSLLIKMDDMEAAAEVTAAENADFQIQIAAACNKTASLRSDRDERLVKFSKLERQLARAKHESAEDIQDAEAVNQIRQLSSGGGARPGYDNALKTFLGLHVRDVRQNLRASANAAEEVEERHIIQMTEQRAETLYHKRLAEASDVMLMEILQASSLSAEEAAATVEGLSGRVCDLENQLLTCHAELAASERIRAAAAAALGVDPRSLFQGRLSDSEAEIAQKQGLASRGSGSTLLLDPKAGKGVSAAGGRVATAALGEGGVVVPGRCTQNKLGLGTAANVAGLLVVRPVCMVGRFVVTRPARILGGFLRKITFQGQHRAKATSGDVSAIAADMAKGPPVQGAVSAV